MPRRATLTWFVSRGKSGKTTPASILLSMLKLCGQSAVWRSLPVSPWR
jgi:hypothetical protein